MPQQKHGHQSYSDAKRVEKPVREYRYIHIRRADLHERLRQEAAANNQSVAGRLEDLLVEYYEGKK